MNKISYSQINTFKQCPRKFDLLYNFNFNKSNVLSDEINKGINLHKQIETYFLNDTITEDIYELIFTNFIKNLKSKSEYEIEKTIETRINNFILFGKIDYIHFNKEENEYTIVDFKTGKKRIDFYQLRMYMIMLSHMYFIKNIKTLKFNLFLYFTEDNSLASESYEFNNLENILYINLKETLLKDILNMNKNCSLKKPSVLCESCNAREECFAIDRINKENILEESKILFNSEYSLFDKYYEGNLSAKILYINFSNKKNVYDKNITNFKNYIYKNNKNINDYLITPGNFYIHDDYENNLYSLESTFNMIYSLIKIFNIEKILINDIKIKKIIERELLCYDLTIDIEALISYNL